MTDEEIVDMVLALPNYPAISQLVAFAHAIAAKQRDIDAGICERLNTKYAIPFVAVEECAAAIRSQK